MGTQSASAEPALSAATLRARSLEALSWPIVRKALEERVRSPLGGEVAAGHRPFESAAESRRFRVRVAEAAKLLTQNPVHAALSGTGNPGDYFDRASRDGVLAPQEIWICGHFLETLGRIGEELREMPKTAPQLHGDFQAAPKTPPLSAVIGRSVSSDGAILDTASSELARLRALKASKKSQFESLLDAKIKHWHGEGLLQDRYYDVLDGRYVVPVRVDQQSKLTGVLLGRSNTGQSIFVEPTELTVPNNELKEVELALRAEEFRILRELSGSLGRLSAETIPWIEPVAELDLFLAAAKLAQDWKLTQPDCPEPSEDRPLTLVDLFHPALLPLEAQGKTVVRNDVGFASMGRALIISGPNTGGKTVLMKAVGLASCMARAGLFVPAAEGAVVPHYHEVLALVGDEQSISAGLSSFSAQIADLLHVLRAGDRGSLIIIDEILSSTDPEEASALAQALIEEFVELRHQALVTTHFAQLPLRCRENRRIDVAAMEFHDQHPTYRLRKGELGASHALEVAERLGLPEKVLKRARTLISGAKLDFEQARKELKSKELDLENEKRRAIEQAARAQAEWEKKALERESALERKVAEFLAKAEQSLKAALEKIAQRPRVIAQRTAKEVSEELQAGIKTELGENFSRTAGLPAAPPRKLAKDDRVRIINPKDSMHMSQGTVLSVKTDERGETAVLQVGNFRVERKVEDLELEAPKKQPSGGKRNYESRLAAEAETLDLRGMRFEEAMSHAEHGLDHAFRSGYAQITIITGHGTGALKSGLKDLLKSLPYVKDYRPALGHDDGSLKIELDV